MAGGNSGSKSAQITSSDTAASSSGDVTNVPEGQPQPQPARAATVAQARYAENSGWEVGQSAPADRWRKLDPQGNLTGKALSSPPKGEYATQVAIKGQTVTNSVRAELGLD